jgi:glycosyltransferase involved in cell wall biosynthesis
MFNPFRKQQRFVLWPGTALLDGLRSFRPEVVHLHDPLAMGLPALRAAQRLDRPVVLTVHALPEVVGAHGPRLPGLQALLTWLGWEYARAFASQCQALAAPSPATAAAVERHTGSTVHVVSDGVDLNVFAPKVSVARNVERLCRLYGLEPGVPIIATVGRLDRDKGVEVILKAMAQVMHQVPAQLVVAGDGTERQTLENLSRRLGIDDRVRFTGFLSPEQDLPDLYRLANVFVIASKIETLGMVVVEAAACGLPVVAVRATSLPGLVDDGQTGWLVPPDDPASMAGRLIDLLRHPGQARAMGQAGRAKMEQHYAFEATIAAYERLYTTLLRVRTETRMRSKHTAASGLRDA